FLSRLSFPTRRSSDLYFFDLKLQNLKVGYFDPDDRGTHPVAIPTSNKFRYVIIPGGVAAKSKLSKEQIKKMSYQEAKQRFGIREDRKSTRLNSSHVSI